jgi:GNAT superfamily N-acetyltransferase
MTHPTTDRPVTIRLARPEDLPEVHRMLIALAAHHGEQATITPQVLGRIALEGPAARLLVALLQDSPQRHPVGYALVLFYPDMVTGGRRGLIEQLFVQEPDRKRGIGRALIAAARAEANGAGCGRLIIGAHPENDGAALAYRAMGLAEPPPPGPRFAVA